MSSSSGHDARERGHKEALLCLIPMLAALVLYLPAIRFGFIWDDIFLILENPWLRDPAAIVRIFTQDSAMYLGKSSGYYRPLQLSLYLGIFQAFGPNPLAFHAASVLIHAMNAGLVFLVARKLQAHRGMGASTLAAAQGAIFAALLFAVHPANVDAVAWVSGADNLLPICFGLLALLVHLWARPGTFGFLSGFFLLLALLSKEVALVFPALLLIHDLLVADGGRIAALRARWRRHAVHAAAVGAYVVMRIVAFSRSAPRAGGGGFSWDTLLLDGPLLLAENLRMLVLPHPMHVWPDYSAATAVIDPRFVAVVVLVLALALLCVQHLRGGPGTSVFASAVMLLPLVPVLYLPAIGQPLAPRRLYLPSMGLGLFLADRLLPSSTPARLQCARRGAAVLVLAAFAGLAALRLPAYANGLSYWSEVVRENPGEWRAHLYLGIALADAGRLENAIAEVRLGIALAPAVDVRADGSNDWGRWPKEEVLALGHFNLGQIRTRQGLLAEAVAEYRRALAANPRHFPSLTNLAQFELDSGNAAEALRLLDRAAAIAPQHPWVRNRHGVALLLNNRGGEGLAELEAAVQLAPWDSELRSTLEEGRRWLGRGGAPLPQRSRGSGAPP